MNASARNAYMGGMVSTASPARLLVMLFERLGTDVDRAIASQEAGDFLAASPHLIHAQEIVLELRSSLDHDVWDGAARLDSIYSWLHRELIRANISRDVDGHPGLQEDHRPAGRDVARGRTRQPGRRVTCRDRHLA